ncbi:hypothetical protein MACJ_002706 [Theileria orientalis]|uniref:Uncharacterized protein n=1 Tax=Theileria orientalis TaxID=68886 RepID=A0A976QSW1_THEOR|nr:hypothetical protein MACJ_002706 [Theileria orientalis]
MSFYYPIYSTPYVNNFNSRSSKNNGPFNNTSNITFVCPFSSLIKKTLETQIKNNELLVNFKDYYVYDEENKLIDKAVLTTNSNFNKFLICNHFPNKDCKTVFMYLVDSNQKLAISPNTNQYNDEYTSNFKEEEPISLNQSSLVYDIDIISKNIVYKHYDPNSNVYEVELGEELKESNDKSVDNKQKDDVLLKLDLTNPYLTYGLNGVKIKNNLTSLNSLKLNNNKLDSSYILVSHNILSNKSSFVTIKIKYKTTKLNKIRNSILIRVTKIPCNNSAESLYTNNNNSDSSTIETSTINSNDTADSSNGRTGGDNHKDGRPHLCADGRHVDHDVLSDDVDSSNAVLLGTNDIDNNSINSINNIERNNNEEPRIYSEKQVSVDGDTNTLNKLDKNINGDDINEWILTENDEKYEKFVSLGKCPLKIEVIRQNTSSDDTNLPIYLNGFKLQTDHYKVLVNSSTSFNIKFNNKTYKLKVSDDPVYKIPNSNVAENMDNTDSRTINDSGADSATANDFRGPEININDWVANFVTIVIRIITFFNIFSNISRFYFESLNYITFLVLFYGYLSGNFDNVTNNSTTGSLLNKLTEKIISCLLIYIDNVNNLVPVKVFLLLNLVYMVNIVAIMGYLSFIVASNFKSKLGKKLKRLETNILALFIYLLLLMLLVFLKFDRNNEDVYMMGHRFNSFHFSSITLFLTILIILIIYQMYPRRRMNRSLNNTLFSFLDESNRRRTYPNSLPINSIYKSSNDSSPLNSLKTISGIKHTIGNGTKSKSTSPKSGYSNSVKFGGLVDFQGTLSTNNSDDPVLDTYRTVHSFPEQADEINRNYKRDKVVINDKYRLLYINSLIVESTSIVIYYILSKREDGIYLVKFTFWLLVSLYIQRLNKYYDEKKINKYLLIKSLKYMVLAALIRIHILVQNKLLETGSGVGTRILGVSIGQLMAVIILIHINQCINHKSLSRLYKSVFKIK